MTGTCRAMATPAILAAVVCVAGCAGRDARIVRDMAGHDWSLPAGARMAPRAGLITWAKDDPAHEAWVRRRARLPRFADGGLHQAVICYVKWADVNPREGEFDFSVIDGFIDRYCSTPGVGFTLWPAVYNRDVLPGWLMDKPGMTVLPDGTLPAWRPDCPYQESLDRLFEAMADRYADDPRLVAVELRGLDRAWGEMYYHGDLAAARDEHGFTPEAFEAWCKRYIDDAVTAFRGHENKLVWLRQGGPSSPNYFHATLFPEYEAASKRVTRYAYDHGLGRRDGGLEVWTWYTWNAELYGQRVTDAGYLETIEDFPPLANGRPWYTENEIVEGAPYLWPDAEALRVWPILCLRAIQMRCNWVWIEPDFYSHYAKQHPGLNYWFELSLGQTVRSSPDAWSWLREGYVWGHDGKWGLHTIKNFERWLFQRDVPGDGRTRTAEWFDVSGYGKWIREWYFGKTGGEWHARRTDLAAGQCCIYFRAAREFLAGGPHDVLIKVTFRDRAETAWRLEYEGPGGPAASPLVRTRNSGDWRTVTIRVPQMHFDGALPGQMDFRLAVDGPGDLTVKFVRVVKNTAGDRPQRRP